MAARCYLPNGNISPDDEPCNASAEHSACCRPEDVCLDNGYCLGGVDAGPNVITRTTCTDSTFNDKGCASFCKDFNPQQAAVLFLYHFSSPSTYCCGPPDTGSGTCVQSTLGSNAPFALPNANIIIDRSTGATAPMNATQIKTTNTTSDGTAAAAAVTVTAKSTAEAAAMATTTITQPDTSREVAIGAGVAVPLGVLLLCALTGLLFQGRRRSQAQNRWDRERESLIKRLDDKSMYYASNSRFAPPLEADNTSVHRPQYAELGAGSTPKDGAKAW